MWTQDATTTGDGGHSTLVIKCGYMHKRGKHNTSWKQRWFTLQGNLLHYAKAQDARTSIDSIPIQHALVIEPPVRAPNDFSFQLQTAGRQYYLMAPSQQELISWTNAIKSVSQAHDEEMTLARVTFEIECAVRSQVRAEASWVARLNSLHGTLHTADGLQRFAIWLAEQQTQLRRQHSHSSASISAPAPLPPRASLWLRRQHVQQARAHHAHAALSVGKGLLRIWTVCEEMRLLCPANERCDLAKGVVALLEQDAQLRSVLGIVPSSTTTLAALLARAVEPPPTTLLVSLQKRAFAALRLAHKQWTSTLSCGAALLHLGTYADVWVSDRFYHAVLTCDPYRSRSLATTNTQITLKLSQNPEEWIRATPGAGKDVDVNALNIKSLQACAEESGDGVIVYHLDECYWREYETECTQTDTAVEVQDTRPPSQSMSTSNSTPHNTHTHTHGHNAHGNTTHTTTNNNTTTTATTTATASRRDLSPSFNYSLNPTTTKLNANTPTGGQSVTTPSTGTGAGIGTGMGTGTGMGAGTGNHSANTNTPSALTNTTSTTTTATTPSNTTSSTHTHLPSHTHPHPHGHARALTHGHGHSHDRGHGHGHAPHNAHIHQPGAHAPTHTRTHHSDTRTSNAHTRTHPSDTHTSDVYTGTGTAYSSLPSFGRLSTVAVAMHREKPREFPEHPEFSANVGFIPVRNLGSISETQAGTGTSTGVSMDPNTSMGTRIDTSSMGTDVSSGTPTIALDESSAFHLSHSRTRGSAIVRHRTGTDPNGAGLVREVGQGSDVGRGGESSSRDSRDSGEVQERSAKGERGERGERGR